MTHLQTQLIEAVEKLAWAKERASQLKEVIANHRAVTDEYLNLIGVRWSGTYGGGGKIQELTAVIEFIKKRIDLEDNYPKAVLPDGSISPTMYVTKLTPKRVYLTKVYGNFLSEGYCQLGSVNHFYNIDFTKSREAFTSWQTNSSDD